MVWKQPIPTDLDYIFGEDYGPLLLYKELIYRSANQDGFFTYKKKTASIKRGQVLFGRQKYALYLVHPNSTIRNWLDKLEKVYKLVDTQRTSNYTIVTVLNYDEIVNMDNQVDKQRTSRGQAEDTSKSVKSVKSEREYNAGEKVFRKIVVLSDEHGKQTEQNADESQQDKNKGTPPTLRLPPPTDTTRALTNQQMWEIAVALEVDPAYVVEKHQKVLQALRNGNRNIRDVYATTMSWLEKDLDRGWLEHASSEAMMTIKALEPTKMEKQRAEARELMKKLYGD